VCREGCSLTSARGDALASNLSCRQDEMTRTRYRLAADDGNWGAQGGGLRTHEPFFPLSHLKLISSLCRSSNGLMMPFAGNGASILGLKRTACIVTPDTETAPHWSSIVKPSRL
jgi:hypothetical protein